MSSFGWFLRDNFFPKRKKTNFDFYYYLFLATDIWAEINAHYVVDFQLAEEVTEHREKVFFFLFA